MATRTLFTNIGELMSLEGAVKKQARGALTAGDLSIKKNQCMAVEGDKIIWTGTKSQLPRDLKIIKKEVSLKGSNVFPGFIDCHTHSIFLGERSAEFEMRNQGVSYQEIARQGGGILSTVRATRLGSKVDLINSLTERLDIFLSQGVTTVEVKSGYGLSAKHEMRLLTAIQETVSRVRVVPTFLGAHALPPEFESRESYLTDLKNVMPQIFKKKLAQRIDIFVEKNYFSIEEAEDFIKFAQKIGFEIAIHADQLTRTGATRLAVECKALSADHAICISEDDIDKLSRSETTAVLLPTADFYIHCPYPPARKLIDRGARVALSTDFNPGTAPSQNIQLVGLLARLHMKMTLPEVFIAMTLGGAYALGLGKNRGALIEGYDADFFVTDKSWSEFFYDLNPVDIKSVWVRGLKKV